MTFERPERLFFLAGAVVFLLALFLGRKRSLVVVPSLRIWREVVRPLRPRLRARLVDALSTLLATAAFAALVVAAARPSVESEEEARLDLVLLVDTSSSLRARDEATGRTRHEAAVAIAESLVAKLRGGDRWALVVPDGATGAAVAVPMHAASERPFARDVLASAATPGLGPVDLDAALRLAHVVAETAPGARVIVISDGVGQGEKLVTSRLPGASFVDVGSPSANRGFVGLERESGEGGRERIALEIASAADADSEATLVAEDDAGETVARRTVPLPRGSVVSTTIDGQFDEGSWLRLRLEPGDAFPLDDEAFVPVGPEPRPGVVVYVGGEGEADPFLQAAIEAADGAIDARRVAYRRREPFVAPEGEDLAVFDGCDGPPETLSGRPSLVFGSDRPGLGLAGDAPGAGGPAAVLGFSIGHPLSAGIPWDAFSVAKSSPLFAVPEGETVVRAAAGALVAAGERSGARFAAFAFRPMDSDIRTRPSLPLLVRNAIEWTLRASAAPAPALARTGGTVAVSARCRKSTASRHDRPRHVAR